MTESVFLVQKYAIGFSMISPRLFGVGRKVTYLEQSSHPYLDVGTIQIQNYYFFMEKIDFEKQNRF